VPSRCAAHHLLDLGMVRLCAMTVPETIAQFLHAHKPSAFCDDCLQKRLGLPKRQEAQQASGHYASLYTKQGTLLELRKVAQVRYQSKLNDKTDDPLRFGCIRHCLVFADYPETIAD
jgi:hypothetical protein